MGPVKKVVLWTLGAWLLIGAAIAFWAFRTRGALSPSKGDRVLAEVKSPDGRFTATAFEQDRSALDDFWYTVWMRSSNDSSKEGRPGVCVWESYAIEPMALRWSARDSLQVIVVDARPDPAKESHARATDGLGIHVSTIEEAGERPRVGAGP